MKALYKIFFLFVLISLSICNDCPENCICEGEEGEEGREEEEEKVCSSCKSGYFGPNCEYSCEKCVECDREGGMCLECKEGFYGDNCEKNCTNCPGGVCFMNGTCSIEGETCVDGIQKGERCDIPCTYEDLDHCLQCKKDGTCTECENNEYYGKECKISCSHCPDNKCYLDGKCIDNSRDCPDSINYGNYCNISCNYTNPNCKTCNR